MSESESEKETETEILIKSTPDPSTFESNSYTWRMLPILNIIVCVYAASCGSYFTNRQIFASKYIHLIDNFDGANVLWVLSVLFYVGAFINLVGAWYTNTSLFKTRKGALKFIVWSYAAWLLIFSLLVLFSLYVSSRAFHSASTEFKVLFYHF